MGDSDLAFFIASIFFVFWGISSLHTGEVYWFRLFKYWGPRIVTKGRIPARVHGVPVAAGGALGVVTSVLALFAPNSDTIDTLLWVCILLVLAGIIGSFLASSLGYGDEEQDPIALEQAMRNQHGDRYGRW